MKKNKLTSIVLGLTLPLMNLMYQPISVYSGPILSNDKAVENNELENKGSENNGLENQASRTNESENKGLENNKNVEFVKSLDLEKLNNLIGKMQYVPFKEYNQIKPAQGNVDTSDLENLIKLTDLYDFKISNIEKLIQNKESFFEQIMKTSKALHYKNHHEWDISGFIRWSTNLVRFWSSYNYEMVTPSVGIGLDIDNDGIGDMINKKYYLSLGKGIKKKACKNPREFVKSAKELAYKIDQTPLDVQLKEVGGKEGKLKLVCRNLAMLNQLVYETSKHLNFSSKNTFCFRVSNDEHMWNIFATVNEQGVFYTSVDPTFADNGKNNFSLKTELDFSSPSHKEFLWRENQVYLFAGTVLKNESAFFDAFSVYNKALKKNPLIYKSELPMAMADLYSEMGMKRVAVAFYKISNHAYSKYQLGYLLHEQGNFLESNGALSSLLNLYDEGNSGKYEDNPFFDEALPLSGLNYFSIKKYTKAIEAFELSLKINPRYRGLSAYWLAKSYLAQSDISNSAAALKVLEKENSDFDPAETLFLLKKDYWY